MSDLAVRAVMTADGSGLVTGAKQAQTALDNLRGSHDTLSVSSKNLTAASREFRAANDEAGLSTYRLTRAMSELGGPMGARVLGMRELLRGSHELIVGLGLLNTAGIAIGIGLLATVGHTTLFRNALEGLESTVSDTIGWFDRLVSGKERVDAAMAKDVIAKYRESGGADELIADLQKLDAFMADRERANRSLTGRRSPSELAEAANQLPMVNPYTLEYLKADPARRALLDKMLPELTVTPNRVTGGADSSSQRFWESQFRGDAFLDAGNGLMAANNMVLDPATGQWVDRRFSSNPFALTAAQKFDQEQSANALKVIGAPGGITGLDSSVVGGFALRNGGGSQAATSQRINDARDTREQISKIEDEPEPRHAEAWQKSMERMAEASSRRMDEIRGDFDEFGASAILNFRDAGKAAEQFLQQLAKIAIQSQILGPIENALFGAQGTPGGGAIGGSLFSGLFGSPGPIDLGNGTFIPGSVAISENLTAGGGFLSGIGDFVSSIFHTGGVVGVEGARRFVHPAVFDGAPRFHSGGIASDEVPIIARKGEGVFTAEQMAALGGASRAAGPAVNVNVHNYSGSNARVQQSQDANGNLTLDVIVDQVESAMADRTARGTSQHARALESTYNLKRTPL